MSTLARQYALGSSMHPSAPIIETNLMMCPIAACHLAVKHSLDQTQTQHTSKHDLSIPPPPPGSKFSQNQVCLVLVEESS